MVFAGERYYNFNCILLRGLGLWPYQKPILLQTVFILGVLTSFTIFQITPILTRYNIDYIVKQLSFILPHLVCLSYYNIFYFNGSLIKRLFEEIKADWNITVERNEVRILEKYGFYSRLISVVLVCSMLYSVLIISCLELLPVTLDILKPLNQSRPRKLIFDFYLFIDEREHFFIYLIYEILVISIGVLSFTGTGSFLIMYLTHCCATYKIASTLIENIETKETIPISVDRRVQVMRQKICRAVHIHRKTIQFIKLLMGMLNKWFFVIIAIGVLSLTCSLLQFVNAVTSFKELPELCLYCIFITMHFVIMFLSNLLGQLIINHSAEIFHAVYRSMWYVAPLSVQKLLLFVMQHSLKADALLIGGIYAASLEGFSTLITTALSYFTVMHNMN